MGSTPVGVGPGKYNLEVKRKRTRFLIYFGLVIRENDRDVNLSNLITQFSYPKTHNPKLIKLIKPFNWNVICFDSLLEIIRLRTISAI